MFGDFKIFHRTWFKFGGFACFFVCQDSAGRSSVREQHFTLEDGVTPSFGFVQSFILLTDHYILGRAAFIFIMLLNVGVLLAFRFLRVPSGRGELSHHHNSILILGNFSAMNRCQNLLELWEETRYTIKNMQAYMSIYHVNKDLHCHIGKSNYLNKNNCSFLKKINIFFVYHVQDWPLKHVCRSIWSVQWTPSSTLCCCSTCVQP